MLTRTLRAPRSLSDWLLNYFLVHTAHADAELRAVGCARVWVHQSGEAESRCIKNKPKNLSALYQQTVLFLFAAHLLCEPVVALFQAIFTAEREKSPEGLT